ncbi:hypothetical protein HZ326_3198 [Fusarium oxysporum f. sp. albedinis]|nr:hypothetical protein HZ326_3198 [Fusarium oxysporum f. sp. albedinis]
MVCRKTGLGDRATLGEKVESGLWAERNKLLVRSSHLVAWLRNYVRLFVEQILVTVHSMDEVGYGCFVFKRRTVILAFVVILSYLHIQPCGLVEWNRIKEPPALFQPPERINTLMCAQFIPFRLIANSLRILRPRAVFPTGANQSTIALANKNQKRYSQAID